MLSISSPQVKEEKKLGEFGERDECQGSGWRDTQGKGGRGGAAVDLLISLLPFSTAGIFTQKVVRSHSSRSLVHSLAHSRSLSLTHSLSLSSAHTHTLLLPLARAKKHTTPLGRFSHGVSTFPSAMMDLKRGQDRRGSILLSKSLFCRRQSKTN